MYVISRGLAKFISINRSVVLPFIGYFPLLLQYKARTELECISVADLLYGLMPMMMLVRDLGLLASMLNMCMNQIFAAHLGHQV